MKSVADGAVSLVLVLVAAFSLFSMIGLLQVDRIVHHDLYRYGLQFNYSWAIPYWTIINVVFAMGWFNIITAIAFQLYLVRQRRKETKSLKTEVEEVQKEVIESEIQSTEKVEEQKEKGSSPSEAREDEQKEIQNQPKQPEQVEERKEPETEQKETKPETKEKSEETPIIIGVSEEEIQSVIGN